MSGRVGDLSPKQAETLAKVRDSPYPVQSWGKWLRDGVERMPRTCFHLLILHVLDISLCCHLQGGLYPPQLSVISPDQNSVKEKAALWHHVGNMCRHQLTLTKEPDQTALPGSCPHYLLPPCPLGGSWRMQPSALGWILLPWDPDKKASL